MLQNNITIGDGNSYNNYFLLKILQFKLLFVAVFQISPIRINKLQIN